MSKVVGIQIMLIYSSYAFTSAKRDEIIRTPKKNRALKSLIHNYLFTYGQAELCLFLYANICENEPYNKLLEEFEKNGTLSPRLKGDVYKENKYYGTKELAKANFYMAIGQLEHLCSSISFEIRKNS